MPNNRLSNDYLKGEQKWSRVNGYQNREYRQWSI